MCHRSVGGSFHHSELQNQKYHLPESFSPRAFWKNALKCAFWDQFYILEETVSLPLLPVKSLSNYSCVKWKQKRVSFTRGRVIIYLSSAFKKIVKCNKKWKRFSSLWILIPVSDYLTHWMLSIRKPNILFFKQQLILMSVLQWDISLHTLEIGNLILLRLLF